MLKYLFIFCFFLTVTAHAEPDKNEMYQPIINNAKMLVWSGKVKANENEFITEPPEGLGKDIAYIPDSGARRVLRYGMVSGMAAACKINWQPHYASLMAYQRNKMKRNPYQMAYIDVLHGAGMSITEDEPCGKVAEKKVIAQNLKQNIQQFRK